MGLRLIAPPTAEPISLSEAKAHLRVDSDAEDSLINSLILSARQTAESYQSRALITQTWELTLDEFPRCPFELPLPPLQSVDEISYTDSTGATHIVNPLDYIVDAFAFRGRVTHAYGKSWPSVILQPINGVKVTFTAGYGDTAADVPQMTRQAMLLLIGQWYENRSNISEQTNLIMRELPHAVTALLRADQVITL